MYGSSGHGRSNGTSSSQTGNISRLRSLVNSIESEERLMQSRYRLKVSQLEESEERVNDLEHQNSILEETLEEKADDYTRLKRESEDFKTKMNRELIGLRFELAKVQEELRKREIRDRLEKECANGVVDFSLESLKLSSQDDLITESRFFDMVKSGSCVSVKRVLNPSVSLNQREDRLHEIMGQALLELCGSKDSSTDIAQMLLDYGADVNCVKPVDQGGRSVLHMAAARGEKAIMNMILKNKSINLDARDARGHTALHLATRLRKIDAARLLLQHGADVTLKTPEGESAEDLANDSSNKQWFSLSFSKVTMKQVFQDPKTRFLNSSFLALRHYKADRLDLAFDQYTSAVEFLEKNPLITDSINASRVYYNRGKIALKLGEVFVALQSSDNALALQDSYASALELRAECNLLLFDFERAANDYKLLQDISKSDSRSCYMNMVEARRFRDASHHSVLRVKHGASSAVVKRAFKVESMRWHPDKHNMSKDDAYRAGLHFRRVNEARERLLESRAYSYSDSEDETDPGPFPWSKEPEPFLHKKHSYIEQQKQREAQAAEEKRLQEEEITRKEALAAKVKQEQEMEQEEEEEKTGAGATENGGTAEGEDAKEREHQSDLPETVSPAPADDSDVEDEDSLGDLGDEDWKTVDGKMRDLLSDLSKRYDIKLDNLDESSDQDDDRESHSVDDSESDNSDSEDYSESDEEFRDQVLEALYSVARSKKEAQGSPISPDLTYADIKRQLHEIEKQSSLYSSLYSANEAEMESDAYTSSLRDVMLEESETERVEDSEDGRLGTEQEADGSENEASSDTRTEHDDLRSSKESVEGGDCEPKFRANVPPADQTKKSPRGGRRQKNRRRRGKNR